MEMNYAITAPRNIRALYYTAEYGVRGAAKLLAVEPRGVSVVRVPAGTASREMGLFRTRRDATHWQTRVMMMAAYSAGRIGQGCPGNVLIDVVQATAGDFVIYRSVRPLASS